ncbi:MAG: cell division/cell wall cluster transcriptional repressor MraZ [Treponema sp.]|nr:cell division/cell wall cluster transcriptional repressor MraZ [Treponema sp.]
MALRGRTNVSLDERSRLTLPVQLREELGDNNLFISQGLGKSLWLFGSAAWYEKVEGTVSKNSELFSEQDQLVVREYISPSHEIKIDKAGRILIPEDLREYAGITKECKVVGMLDHIEIWDLGLFQEYQSNPNRAAETKQASEALSRRVRDEKGRKV